MRGTFTSMSVSEPNEEGAATTAADPHSEPHFGVSVGAPRRLLPLILAVAVLSAALSAAGTYAAITLTYRPAAAAATASSQPAASGQTTLTESEAIVRVARQVKPSVVTVLATGATGVTPFSVPATGAGSGFIATADGLIVTNSHVIKGAASLTVILDDTRQLAATVVSVDEAHDLALIRVTATGLTPVILGDSGSIQVGQLAIAIGSPLGTYTDSVTQGIVSGLNRTISIDDLTTGPPHILSGLIQTDASVNPGNSGGPLLDAAGSVVGIVTATAADAHGVGFAVPINQAKQMIVAATK
jgi:serine protease Do